MRVIHFARSDARYAEPLCGDWGSMDTDWTDSAAGVTCEPCRGALGAAHPPSSIDSAAQAGKAR